MRRARPRALTPIRAQLANGLSVRVLEDPSLPIAAYLTMIGAGSRHERPGRTGMAHFLEHLMFTGSKRYPKGAYDFAMESNGCSPDAYTKPDVTAYFVELPAKALPVVIDVESARLTGLLLEDAAVENERAVIREERRMTVEASPGAVGMEALCCLLFQSHPYRWPIIGFPADIEAVSQGDCLDYYREHYRPANTTIWVAGAVSADDIFHRIERAYGKLKPRPAGGVSSEVQEPPQEGPRHAEVRRAGMTPLLVTGVRAPAAKDPRALCLDVLDAAFASTDQAPLRRSLFGSRAAYVESGWTVRRDEGVYALFAEPAPGVSLRQLQRTVESALDKLPGAITDEVLDRARAQLKAVALQQFDSRLGRADALAAAEMLTGDADSALQRLDALDQIDRRQVSRLAEEMFASHRRASVWVMP